MGTRVWARVALVAVLFGPARVYADPPLRVVAVGGLSLTDAQVAQTRTRNDILDGVRALVSTADLTLGQLTSVLTDGPSANLGPHPGEGASPRGACAGARLLRGLGVDVVSLAHARALDLGASGALDTLRCVRGQGVAAVGMGDTDEAARAPFRTTVGGLRLGVLAFTADMLRPDVPGVRVARGADDPAAAVRALRPSVDVVIVYAYWGEGVSHDPSAAQVALAHSLVDAGADVVVGHHPRVVQAAEVYRGRPVVYGLGQLFAAPQPTPQDFGAVLSLSLAPAARGASPVRAATLTPFVRLGRQAEPFVATGPQGDPLRALLRDHSARLGTRMDVAAGVLHLRLATARAPRR